MPPLSGHLLIDWSPVWLSIRVASWATLISIPVGLAVAIPLARGRFRGRSLLEGIANLPLILPPTVLGYALLVGLGRRSEFGRLYESVFGQPLVFTWQGAVVAASLASLPLFISHARVAIAAVDKEVVEAARIDGAGLTAILRTVVLPLARPGIAAGIALTFARALGDFGATLMVAGDTAGRTQTMPLAIYDAVLNGEAESVRVFVTISVILCLTVTVIASRLARRN